MLNQAHSRTYLSKMGVDTHTPRGYHRYYEERNQITRSTSSKNR